MRCPRPQKLDGARLCTSTQEKFKSSRSPSSPSYHLIRSNQVPASRRVETQLCLIFCTHWAHLAEHFIERSPTPSRAFASETSARTSCRFDTSSPVPRWCVPRPILVLLAHRQPPRSLLPPADYSPTSPPDQAAGAYYAPAAYKVYEAESAVTAAETALSALNVRIKSVRRDPDPTPSALGQISSILPTEQSLVVPSTVSFQQSNPLTRVVFTPIHPQHTTAVRYRHRARQGDRDQGHG